MKKVVFAVALLLICTLGLNAQEPTPEPTPQPIEDADWVAQDFTKTEDGCLQNWKCKITKPVMHRRHQEIICLAAPMQTKGGLGTDESGKEICNAEKPTADCECKIVEKKLEDAGEIELPITDDVVPSDPSTYNSETQDDSCGGCSCS